MGASTLASAYFWALGAYFSSLVTWVLWRWVCKFEFDRDLLKPKRFFLEFNELILILGVLASTMTLLCKWEIAAKISLVLVMCAVEDILWSRARRNVLRRARTQDG